MTQPRLCSFLWPEVLRMLRWQQSPKPVVGKHDWTAYPDNRFPLTSNPGCKESPLLPFWPFPLSKPPPLLLRGGGSRWAGEISLGGIPVWVFLGVTWVAEERQRKSVSTLLNKKPVWAMVVFHITLISVSILSGSVFSFFGSRFYSKNQKGSNRKQCWLSGEPSWTFDNL